MKSSVCQATEYTQTNISNLQVSREKLMKKEFMEEIQGKYVNEADALDSVGSTNNGERSFYGEGQMLRPTFQ